MSSKSQSMRKVVDKAEKDCTPANQGYAGTKGEDYKVAKAEFGATMKSKLISAIARLVKTHKGVSSYFCYHHQYPVYVCVCVDVSQPWKYTEEGSWFQMCCTGRIPKRTNMRSGGVG